MILIILSAIIISIIGFFTLYLTFLIVLGFIYRFKNSYQYAADYDNLGKKHFAIIVPAHNEEKVIEQTVRSLAKINYPKKLFKIFVIADNCSDRTSLIASKNGAIVLERENKEFIGKGYALKWCFELLLKSRYKIDAFLIIDADTIVETNILKILNSYLNKGSEVMQCADLVKPMPSAWSSEITRVGLYLYNFARPLGRKILNLSAGLRGNGMCFSANLLKKIPWQAYSQTEDLEYGLILLLNGVTVTFAPETKVYAVMPENPKNAESQRARWEIGRFPLLKKYSFILLREAIRQKSFKIFDSFIELITPAFVNIFLLTFVMLILTFFLAVIGTLHDYSLIYYWSLILILQLFYVVGGLYLADADINAYKVLLKVPKFVLWKLLLYKRLLSKGHTRLWVRTIRENSVNSKNF